MGMSGDLEVAVEEGSTAVIGVTYRLAEGKAEMVSGFGAL